MTSIYKAVALFSVIFIGLLVFVVSEDQEVFIESRESKTSVQGPVFNKIKWFSLKGKDVWMMNQSHHGPHADENSWDRLAIVVDNSQSPKVARFYQFEPGPLEWREGLVEKPFRVSCFMCHNNGPRAIRPNEDSLFVRTSLRDKIKISYWNLRMKLYGRVIASSVHDQQDPTQMPPFRFRSGYENESLKLATCIKCHKESGFWARGELKRQQASTIKFMFESGQMPPLGFAMSAKEKQEMTLFLQGF